MGGGFKYFIDDIENISINHIKKQKNKPCWIRIINPVPEKLHILSKLTGLQIHELKIGLESSERPKYSSGSQGLQITYKTPYVHEGQLAIVPLHIFIINNVIVTIEKEPIIFFNDLAASLSQKNQKNFFKNSIAYFIAYVFDKVNDEFLTRVEDIAEKLEAYETDLKFEKKDLEEIYNYNISLTYFNQALVANLEVLNSIKKSFYKEFSKKDRDKFQDLYYDALHVLDTQKIQRDIIGTLLKLQNNISQGNLNSFIKRLTALTVILMVPTIVTGIYGMNFDYIPLSSNPFGFFITIGVGIILVTLVLSWVFYKVKWF